MKVFIGYLIVMSILIVTGLLIEKYVIPHLNPDNKFKVWWKNNIVDEDPYH